MSDVATEIAHHAKGVGQKRLHMGIGLVESRRSLSSIRKFSAVEPHLEQEVDRFTDLAFVHVLLGLSRHLGEVMVQIAA